MQTSFSGTCPEKHMHCLTVNKKNATKAKPLSEATAKDVIPQVTWIWRFSWDHVQQKMTARKPFLSLGTNVKMTKGQCIKLTI